MSQSFAYVSDSLKLTWKPRHSAFSSICVGPRFDHRSILVLSVSVPSVQKLGSGSGSGIRELGCCIHNQFSPVEYIYTTHIPVLDRAVVTAAPIGETWH